MAGQNINPSNWGISPSACCLASFRALATCTVGMATVLLRMEKRKWKHSLEPCRKSLAGPRNWPFLRQRQMCYKPTSKKKKGNWFGLKSQLILSMCRFPNEVIATLKQTPFLSSALSTRDFFFSSSVLGRFLTALIRSLHPVVPCRGEIPPCSVALTWSVTEGYQCWIDIMSWFIE